MNGKQEVVIHVPLLKKSDLPSGIAGSFFHGPGALCIFMGCTPYVVLPHIAGKVATSSGTHSSNYLLRGPWYHPRED